MLARYGRAYVLVVQCVAVVAAAVILLWLGPEQWDALLHQMALGYELRPTWQEDC